ncbi:hypothetical protein LXL04_032871 [Taraxacum kok-saghyz]
MKRSKTQTHDFINNEPFSPLPPKENSIRLFGKEFGGGDLATLITEESSSPETTAFIHNETKENPERKFECNYCCRNFPTSQALGGHQNAHRRERLKAKRPHIQPNFSTAHHHEYYDLTTTTPPPPCPINQSNNIRFINGGKASYISHHQTPINGRPLALWRFPIVVHKSTAFNNGGLLNSSETGSRSRNVYMHELKPNIRDQVIRAYMQTEYAEAYEVSTT